MEAIFDTQFTVDKVAVELKLFEQEYNYSFERTYGWAWFLKLQQVGERERLETIIDRG